MLIEPGYLLAILLLVLLFAYVIISKVYSLYKKFDADIKFRIQRRYLPPFKTAFVIFGLIYLAFQIIQTDKLFFLSGIFLIPLLEIVLRFYYKKKKPYMIYIRGNELITKENMIQERDMTELTGIIYDRYNTELELYFKSKSKVKICTKCYRPEDIRELLNILLETSKHEVSIPSNFSLP